MASLKKQSSKKPDEVRQLGKGKVNVFSLSSGNAALLEYPPGWKWSTDGKPIHKTDSCQLHHLGSVVSGRIHVQMSDGSEDELGPGDVYEVPPGHDAWVVGNEPFVAYDFGALAKLS